MSILKKAIRSLLHRWDLDIFQLSAIEETVSVIRRRRLMAEAAIDIVIDVGANEGQFGSFLRHQIGYTGTVVSFEPVSSAFAVLSRRVAADPNNWQVVNKALGSQPGTATIHVSANSQSSSLLNMLDRHSRSAPDSVYVGKEEITVSTLDIEFTALGLDGARTYLKIDTQGFERSVIEGAERTLAGVRLIELEMSFVPLYEGQPLFAEMLELMRAKGFVMVSIDPMFIDRKTQEILQADVLFARDQPQAQATTI